MKKIVVTGGASGIGAAVAELLKDTCEVIVLDKSSGTDVTDGRQLRDAFENIGAIDGLVHCAGIYIQKHLTDMSDEEIAQQIEVNLTGTALVNKYALLHMNNGGAIVNISSVLSLVPELDSPVYSASKAGINMLTKSLSQTWAPKNIRINAILPGPVDTPLLRAAFKSEETFAAYEKTKPLGRIARPEEIAKLAAYLLSDNASFITGACMPIDGGESASSLYTA